jgi:hypothetical protein
MRPVDVLAFAFFPISIWHLVKACYGSHSKRTSKMSAVYFYSLFLLIPPSEMLSYGIPHWHFTEDMLANALLGTLTTFTFFHHIMVLILCSFASYGLIVHRYIDILRLHEISTTILTLFKMGIIKKGMYDRLFSITFIAFRIIHFNYHLYDLFTLTLVDTSVPMKCTLIGAMMYNIMNIVIVWYMGLIPKAIYGARSTAIRSSSGVATKA